MEHPSHITKWFAVIAFFVGGAVVYYSGLQAFQPPAPPSGTVLCGNGAMGGLFLMVFGTPMGAIASALAAWGVGWMLDRVLSRFVG